MSYIRENLDNMREVSDMSRALEARKSVILPNLRRVVIDALSLYDTTPIDIVDFIYPTNDGGDLAVVYQWQHETYTDDIIVSAEDLTAERPGIAYRLRMAAIKAARRNEELHKELATARAKVLSLEARLGE